MQQHRASIDPAASSLRSNVPSDGGQVPLHLQSPRLVELLPRIIVQRKRVPPIFYGLDETLVPRDAKSLRRQTDRRERHREFLQTATGHPEEERGGDRRERYSGEAQHLLSLCRQIFSPYLFKMTYLRTIFYDFHDYVSLR